MRCILLNPGPVSLSDTVRKAAVGNDLCHRESEYLELQEEVRQGLLDVYGCHPDLWASVLLGGSGTTALEAMLTSLPPRDAKLERKFGDEWREWSKGIPAMFPRGFNYRAHQDATWNYRQSMIRNGELVYTLFEVAAAVLLWYRAMA